MMPNKRLIAVSGGIGAGKSTVTDFFRQKGETCFSCDRINAELLTDENYLNKLKNLFPTAFENGIFRKELLGKLIFSDAEERKKLNELSHAEILARLLDKIEKTTSNLVFVEVPLLVGSGFENYFSEWIRVTASDDVRAERICKRDNIDMAFARLKIASQRQYETASSIPVVYTITNEGSTENLLKQLEKLYLQIKG